MCLFGLIELTFFYSIIFISTFEVEWGDLSLTLSRLSFAENVHGVNEVGVKFLIVFHFHIYFYLDHIFGFGRIQFRIYSFSLAYFVDSISLVIHVKTTLLICLMNVNLYTSFTIYLPLCIALCTIFSTIQDLMYTALNSGQRVDHPLI